MPRQHEGAPATIACIWPGNSNLTDEIAQRLNCWAGAENVNTSSSPLFHFEVEKDLCTSIGPLKFTDAGADVCPLPDDLTVNAADPLNPSTCGPVGDLEQRVQDLEDFEATKGQPNGLATLDGTGNVPLSQLGNAPGGTAAVNSVNGDTGDVVLDAADVGAAPTVHTHTQAQVTGLTAALTSKANDADVVHDAGDETISGIKTFISLPTIPAIPIDPTDAASKSYVDSMIVGAPVTSVNGDTGAVVLDASDVGAAPTVHTHTQAQVTNLVTDLAAKATDSAVVHLAGPETITGAKTFSAATIFNNTVALINTATWAMPNDTTSAIVINQASTVNPNTSNDLIQMNYKAARAGWFNEWGGLRVRVPSIANLGYSDNAVKLFEQTDGTADGLQIFAPADGSTPSIRTRGGVLYANNLNESAWIPITINSPQTASKFTANTNGTNDTNSPQVQIIAGGKRAILRGRINSVTTGGVTDEIIATTMPTSITVGTATVSAVPLQDRGFTAMGSGGGIRMLIRKNGNLQMLGSANTQPYIMLDGIEYSLEA